MSLVRWCLLSAVTGILNLVPAGPNGQFTVPFVGLYEVMVRKL